MTNGNDAPNPPDEIVRLVEQFDAERAAYRSGKYNETQVRREFIDPFFTALGWDVENKSGARPSQREVVHEYTLRTAYGTKAPDYCFYTGGERRFFVEAKKPSVDLKHDPTPAFQVRRYGWSAGLDLSILTDFEELVVYNCRAEPSAADPSSVGQLLYLDYTQYLDQWPRISSLFSKQAVLTGSLTDFIGTVRATRGATVDAAFLKEISGWRDALAIDIAQRNPTLHQRDLNYAVQMTIDRILFLRICEARGIDTRNRLEELSDTHSGIYSQLGNLFRDADDRYNSGLFHFNRQRGPNDADTFTLDLSLGDAPLHNILRRIYPPYSPYAFDVLPVEILGQVYEQFLGKVITLSPTGSVTVEEKPEVRKAGGVYYTPTYIVDYIVKNTVGKLLDGKTPRQADALRILDPACGSGSFLIGAYSYLLQWHLDEYIKAGLDKRDVKPRVETGQDGAPRLTINERKRILLNNIFGVDIDTQAVEVTKLSLLLKVLEGETERSLATQLTMFHERALPDLASNIKCGNSLIASDFYQDKQSAFVDMEEARRINAFDWDGPNGFPQIMQAGGFDAVIGNPPYFNIDDSWGRKDERLQYIRQSYPHVYNDKTDILFYFLAKAVELAKGEVTFIISRAFLEAYKANKLRGWLSEIADIREIIDFQNYYVFKGIGISTAIVSLDKRTIESADFYRLNSGTFTPADLSKQKNSDLFSHHEVSQSNFTSEPWLFAHGDTETVRVKIDAAGQPIGTILTIGQGMQTGRNNVFGKLTQEQLTKWGVPKEQYFMRVRNSDIQRFYIRESDEMLLYVEDVANFADLPVGVQQYLELHKPELEERAAYQRGDCDWWRYTWPLHEELYDRSKLYCPYLATTNRFAIDADRRFLGLTDTTILFDSGQPESLLYILGLLNSKLLTFRFGFIGKLKSGGIREYFWNSVSKLPIRTIDPTNPADKKQHDAIVSLVEQMLSLHKQLAEARNPQDKTFLQTRIDATDRQIDRLVYDLYNLTPDEIKIVEAGTK